jgi:hypothetical protein
MQHIIATHEEREQAAREDMTAVPSPSLSGLPGAHDPQAGEKRVTAIIAEIDVLQERYRRACEYMNWFRPAWDELNEDEQFVLSAFYHRKGGKQEDAGGEVCERFYIERASAHRKKCRAREKLTTLLYGR